MNSQTHRFYISRLVVVFTTILLGFLSASGVSAMGDADANRNKVADFDGDGKSDISVFRPSDGFWHIMKSSGGFSSVQWGQKDDALVPGDYDGDGKTDVAVYRYGIVPNNGAFVDNFYYIRRSSDNTFFARQFGRMSLLEWNAPAPADYDGDGKTDLAVFRTNNFPQSTEFNTWFILQSSNGALRVERFGLPTDRLVPSDYDGDGKADIAVFRPSNGFWYILQSRDGFRAMQFGVSEDKPTPADYDGDGRTDIAVFRPSNGTWYLQQSREGFAAYVFGFPDDIPIPNVYVR